MSGGKWPMAGAPVDEINATLLTSKTTDLTDRFEASGSEIRPSLLGQFQTLR